MISSLWVAIVGNIGTAELGIFAAAVGFIWEKISLGIARKKEARRSVAEDAILDAVMVVAQEEREDLGKKNDITAADSAKLLGKAVEKAAAIGAKRGVDVKKVFGGTEGISAATQSIFKNVKNTFKRE